MGKESVKKHECHTKELSVVYGSGISNQHGYRSLQPSRLLAGPGAALGVNHL